MVPSGSPADTPKSPKSSAPATRAALELPYRPREPKSYRPAIALLGCGGITPWHLRAYRSAGYRVVAFCDVNLDNAKRRRDEFYPDAEVTDDVRKFLALDDVEIVDVATHTEVRPPLIEAALRAGKHVLSQKPFVVDLEIGERLADLADKQGVKLAVNQNGRWAPHFSYIREAVRGGIVGVVDAVHCDVHWDHSWVEGTVFETIHDLILYDFAIHWFDFVTTVMHGRRPERVFAAAKRSATQTVAPPLLAQAAIEYADAQASLVFDAHTKFGKLDRVYVAGSAGSITSSGPSDKQQSVEVVTADGVVTPTLVGSWFPDGFHGAMAELLCAIEERREPTHGARNNLESLALCFAAVESAARGEAVVPGIVRRLPKA